MHFFFEDYCIHCLQRNLTLEEKLNYPWPRSMRQATTSPSVESEDPERRKAKIGDMKQAVKLDHRYVKPDDHPKQELKVKVVKNFRYVVPKVEEGCEIAEDDPSEIHTEDASENREFNCNCGKVSPPDPDLLKIMQARIDSLETQVSMFRRQMEGIKKVFNSDQIDLMTHSKIVKWSAKTLETGRELRRICSLDGYEMLRSIGYPLPSIRAMNRNRQALREAETNVASLSKQQQIAMACESENIQLDILENWENERTSGLHIKEHNFQTQSVPSIDFRHDSCRQIDMMVEADAMLSDILNNDLK